MLKGKKGEKKCQRLNVIISLANLVVNLPQHHHPHKLSLFFSSEYTGIPKYKNVKSKL